MALVESLDIPLGSKMPAFHLADAQGKYFASPDCFGPKGLLVLFTCNHCPYALAQWPRFIALADRAKNIGINTVAINPNIHPAYPQDAPGMMLKLCADLGIRFPYLVDAEQQTARAFKAQCTPDPYLFDREARLVYHGRLDDHWQDEQGVSRRELLEAIETLSAGGELNAVQKPAMGCSIKWVSSL